MTTSPKLNFRRCQPKDILTNRTVNLFQYRVQKAYKYPYYFFKYNKSISWHPYCIFKRNKDIYVG